MDKSRLKELIIEHKNRFLSKSGLVRRAIQNEINLQIESKEIVLITGPRRSGKSSLMMLISKDLINNRVSEENILYLNFEDERFVEFEVNDFERIYELFLELCNPRGRYYFFFDEIQNVTNWERWINRLFEFENIKMFITGSNASLLSSDASEALTGRNRVITLYPFSFKEFLSLRDFKVSERSFYLREEKAKIKNYFNEYLNLGGFPEILITGDKSLLEQYFKDIIYRDVISRYSIRNTSEIRELCLYLASNIGTVQGYKSLQNIIGVKSFNTVKNYLEILEEVFLFQSLSLFDYSVKRQIYNPSKIYSIDHALSNSISFKFSENLGHIYENIVFIDLKRRNKEVFYWKSKRGGEVDFIVREGLKVKNTIQVSLSLELEKTKIREIKSLMNAKEELNSEELTIITNDYESEETIEGEKVNIISIWKWLLL